MSKPTKIASFVAKHIWIYSLITTEVHTPEVLYIFIYSIYVYWFATDTETLFTEEEIIIVVILMLFYQLKQAFSSVKKNYSPYRQYVTLFHFSSI